MQRDAISEPHTTKQCVLVGDHSCGKSRLLNAALCGEFYTDEYEDSPFGSYYPLRRDNQYTLLVTDFIAFEFFSEWRMSEYPRYDIFLVCFSIANPASLQHIEDTWLPEIRAPCPNARFLLIGLQADLRDDALVEEPSSQVTREKAIAAAAELGAIKYLECSSLLGYGVREVFAEALDAALQFSLDRDAAQSQAVLIPSTRTNSLSGSILRLPRRILELPRRLQHLREPGKLSPIPLSPIPEIEGSSAEEKVGASEDIHSAAATEVVRRESRDFEETLRTTYVYAHHGQFAGMIERHLAGAPSIRDTTILAREAHKTILNITPSTRSLLSVAINSVAEDRRSHASWGSAERNATANLEIIEHYAAALESLEMGPSEGYAPHVTQSWSNNSAGGYARVHNGNVHHSVTNHFTIIYNITVADERTVSTRTVLTS